MSSSSISCREVWSCAMQCVNIHWQELATLDTATDTVAAGSLVSWFDLWLQELEMLQQDSSVEWFTEPPNTPREHEDLERVRREVPNLTLMTDSDLIWTWHQMWTADIFIMSKSGYSFVPAVVNTGGMIIHAPAAGIRKCKIACAPSHWFEAGDEYGALSHDIKAEIRARMATGAASGAAAGSSPAFTGSAGMLPVPVAAGSTVSSSSLLQPRFGPPIPEGARSPFWGSYRALDLRPQPT